MHEVNATFPRLTTKSKCCNSYDCLEFLEILIHVPATANPKCPFKLCEKEAI